MTKSLRGSKIFQKLWILNIERNIPLEEVHNEDLKDGALNEDRSDDSVSPQEEEQVQQTKQSTSESLTAQNTESEIVKERETEKEELKPIDDSGTPKEDGEGSLQRDKGSQVPEKEDENNSLKEDAFEESKMQVIEEENINRKTNEELRQIFKTKWSYSGLVSAYRLGLLEEITLDNKFSDQLLTRSRMYRLLQSYDSILERNGIKSDKAETYLQMFSDEEDGSATLISPNQVISRAEAMKILFDTFEGEDLSADHTVELNLPYISQVTPVYAPVGCEPISLLMGLRYRGYAKDVSIRAYLDKVPRDKDDPEIAFAGSPYVPNKNLRTTIFPKPLAEYGKKYGADVIDLTGKDTEDLKRELYRGRPVVAYVTLYWRKPYYRSYRIKGEKRTYLRNNHALVLAGYDPSSKKFLVFDPYNVKGIKSKYRVEENTFKELYEVRKHAVSIR